MDIKKIREWTQKTASKYCKSCRDTCCNGRKHRINVEESKLEPFLEKGVVVFELEELLEKEEEKIFMGIHKGDLTTKTGKRIQKPALIQHSKLHYNTEINKIVKEPMYALYVDKYCPMYDENKKCEIHENPRRPEVCKRYPVFIHFEKYVVFSDSCEKFNLREVREEFRRKFPEPEVQLGIRNSDGSVIYCSNANEREYGIKI